MAVPPQREAEVDELEVARRARGVKEVLNELENRVDQDATLKP